MRFINDDVTLKVGGRKAAKIDQSTLKQKIEEIMGDDGDFYELQEIIQNDLKYQFDFENETYDPYNPPIIFGDTSTMIGKHLVGYNTLPNGLTFLGIQAGGDWEDPVFFIVYYDGNKMRAYIPTYGNMVNQDFKTAFGSEQNRCPVTFTQKQITDYKNVGINLSKTTYDTSQLNDFALLEKEFNEEFSEAYFRKYGLNQNTVGFNWDAIKTDIMSRIIVQST